MDTPDFRLAFIDSDDVFELDDGALEVNERVVVRAENVPAFIEWLTAEHAKWKARQEASDE